MSVIMMGAVLSRGPRKGSLRLALIAIADNADDYGFAYPSISTIADKACVDARTARRLVQQLERDGWIKVGRKALHGKGNVYLMNITKLGVTLNAKMRKSDLHIEIVKKLEEKSAAELPVQTAESGDILSCGIFSVPENSGDNQEGVQGTNALSSEDKIASPFNSINRQEPSMNQTTPPMRGDAEDFWNAAIDSVMLACNSRSRGLRRVVLEQLGVALEKATAAGQPAWPDEIAARMITARTRYLSQLSRGMLRFGYGMNRFYGDGIWENENLWHWDEAKLERASKASIGT